MSRLFEHAHEDVQKSVFSWTEKGCLKVNNMVILQSWSNFTGKPNTYGNTEKYFMLVVTQEVAEDLANQGWTVVAKEDRLPDDATQEQIDNQITLYLVKVKIKYNEMGPEVKMYSKSTRTVIENGEPVQKEFVDRELLNDNNIGCLERALIDNGSCIIRPYHNPKKPGKTTGYLSNMVVLLQQSQSEFGREWDEMEALANLYDAGEDMPFPEGE